MKRRLAIAAVCLLLGAVINVLVAWGWIVVFGVPRHDFRDIDDHPLLWRGYDGEPFEPDEVEYAHRADSLGVTYLLGGWLRDDEYPPLGLLAEGASRRVVAAGFPMRSLYYERTGFARYFDGDDEGSLNMITGWTDGIWIPWRKPSYFYYGFQPGCVLPTLPVWPGFAVNTAIYGVLIWLVGFGPFALRRTLRRRRGRCVRCGYDVAGLTKCPECGACASLSKRRTGEPAEAGGRNPGCL